MSYSVVEASELIEGACPNCHEKSLNPKNTVYTQNIDHELMYTDAICDSCGNEIRILND